MQVFLSWSGDRSKAIAHELKYWLPYVFQRLNVWMSDQDIQAGTKWGIELPKKLGECKLGIICLTKENLQSPWLLFEAGALSTAIDGSRVIPYRFELRDSDIAPPLSQFQGVGADEAGTKKLVESINDALGGPIPDKESLQQVFQHWWPDLKNKLSSMEHTPRTQIRTDRDILEEILDVVRQRGSRDLSNVLARLFSVPNILKVEVAPKQIAGEVTNVLALRITVAKKLPPSQIGPEQLIPREIFGIPTDVVEAAVSQSSLKGADREVADPNLGGAEKPVPKRTHKPTSKKRKVVTEAVR